MSFSRSVLLGIVALALSSIALHAADTNVHPLQGTWQVISARINGEIQEMRLVTTSSMTFDGENFREVFMGNIDAGAIRLNVHKSPAEFDLTFFQGPSTGSIRSGILRLDGGHLVLAISLQDGVRPTAFESKPGCQCSLVELVRTDPARLRPN